MATIQAAEDKQKDKVYSARDARQGDIILVRRWQKVVFITGLALFAMLLLLSVVLNFG